MVKSPRYYQLRRVIRAIRRVTRGRFSPTVEILNQMRVRDYARSNHCGLAEFGLEFDPVARGLLLFGRTHHTTQPSSKEPDNG